MQVSLVRSFASQNYTLPATLLLLLCALASVASGQFATVIDVPPDVAPQQIDSNTQLNLSDGGLLPSGFVSGRSDGSSSNIEINVSGGTWPTTASIFANAGTTLNIIDGSAGYVHLRNNAVLNFDGGQLNGLGALEDAVINMRGGTINGIVGLGNSCGPFVVENPCGNDNIPTLNLFEGTLLSGSAFLEFNASESITNVYGGVLGPRFRSNAGAEINMYGGILGEDVFFGQRSRLNLYGDDFAIDGINVDETLPLNTPLQIKTQGPSSTLTGVLADGSAISIDISIGRGIVDQMASLSIVRVPTIGAVPEPGTFGLLGIGAVLSTFLAGRKKIRS